MAHQETHSLFRWLAERKIRKYEQALGFMGSAYRVNLIELRDLRDIYLVGHSYGGMVVTGAWDRVRERVKHIVYLDAFVPEDGKSAVDYFVDDVGGALKYKPQHCSNGGCQ